MCVMYINHIDYYQQNEKGPIRWPNTAANKLSINNKANTRSVLITGFTSRTRGDKLLTMF